MHVRLVAEQRAHAADIGDGGGGAADHGKWPDPERQSGGRGAGAPRALRFGTRCDLVAPAAEADSTRASESLI